MIHLDSEGFSMDMDEKNHFWHHSVTVIVKAVHHAIIGSNFTLKLVPTLIQLSLFNY